MHYEKGTQKHITQGVCFIGGSSAVAAKQIHRGQGLRGTNETERVRGVPHLLWLWWCLPAASPSVECVPREGRRSEAQPLS